jgi:hypothetical protein
VLKRGVLARDTLLCQDNITLFATTNNDHRSLQSEFLTCQLSFHDDQSHPASHCRRCLTPTLAPLAMTN